MIIITMSLISTILLLLLLLILSISAITTYTSLYNTASAVKQYSRSAFTINNHAAHLIVSNTKAYTTTASARSTNKLTTTAATTSSSIYPPSNVFQSLTVFYPQPYKGQKENNNRASYLTKDRSHYLLLHTNPHHISPKSKSIISSVFKNSVRNAVSFNGKIITIAFIKPSFTAAAYRHSFYVFYTLYQNLPERKNVTTNLNFLTSKVTTQTTDSSSSAHAMFYLYKNIKSLVPKSKMDILTDADVDAGNIFTTKNGFNKYDILVIGHQEYVTQQEYDNLRHFVRSGGTMIILDGNIFYAEVTYNRNTQTITLVKGHGWTFNGVSAWKSVNERWKSETSEWVGSNYLCYRCGITFDNDPFEYKQHEEQYITNPNDVILFNYGASMPKHNKQSLVRSSSKLLSASSELNIGTKHIIATYELSYHKGKVIAFGIYADDIITNKKFDKYFDKLLLKYSR